MSDDFRGLTDRFGARVREAAAVARTYADTTPEPVVVADRVRGLEERTGPEDNYRTYRIDAAAEVAAADARERRRPPRQRPATPPRAAAAAAHPKAVPAQPAPQAPPPAPPSPPPPPAPPALPPPPPYRPEANDAILRRLGVDVSPPPPPERPYARIQGKPVLSLGSLAPTRRSEELNRAYGLLPPEAMTEPPRVGVPPDWDEPPPAELRRLAEELRAEDDRRRARREAPWQRRPLTDFEARLRTQRKVTVIDADGHRVERYARFQPLHDPDTGELIGYLDDRVAGGDIVELVDVHGRVVHRVTVGIESSAVQVDDLAGVSSAGKAGGKLAIAAARRLLASRLGRQVLSRLRSAAVAARLATRGVDDVAAAAATRGLPAQQAQRLSGAATRSGAPRTVPRAGGSTVGGAAVRPVGKQAAQEAAQEAAKRVRQIAGPGRYVTIDHYRKLARQLIDSRPGRLERIAAAIEPITDKTELAAAKAASDVLKAGGSPREAGNVFHELAGLAGPGGGADRVLADGTKIEFKSHYVPFMDRLVLKGGDEAALAYVLKDLAENGAVTNGYAVHVWIKPATANAPMQAVKVFVDPLDGRSVVDALRSLK